MQKLILGLSFVLLMGCDSYTVELDPNWEEDSSGTNINDPSVEEPGTTDPTDTEPPVIELTFDDESEPDDTEPDDTDTSSPDPCLDYVCPAMGAFCFDQWSMECCASCEAGVRSCHEDFSQGTHAYKLVCAGGCWEYEDDCEWGTYCNEDSPGQLSCDPLPTYPDDYCDPSFDWADPDCLNCDPCYHPNDSYCDHSGTSPDILAGCYDATGYGHHCWFYEFCGSGTSEGFCIQDFARNYATCVIDAMPETLCSEFTCTGATLCDDSDGVSDCGYCGTCCEPTLESVCGYTDYTQNSSAILALNTEGLCYEPIDCNADTDLDSAVNRCRISDFGEAVCEPILSGP